MASGENAEVIMARVNWKALQVKYIKAYAKTGVSIQAWCEKKGINYATAKRYIKKPETVFNDDLNCETENQNCENKNQDKSVGYEENCETNCEVNCETAKQNTHPPKGNTFAVKHSGYARYFKDKSIFDQVVDFSLKDEIDLMRQRAVAAIESIEKFNLELTQCASGEEQEKILKLIKSAEQALDRAVARIGSLSDTNSSIQLTLETIELRKAQTKETLLKADKLAQELNIKNNGRNTVQFLDDF